jgi:hypothetical protein
MKPPRKMNSTKRMVNTREIAPRTLPAVAFTPSASALLA